MTENLFEDDPTSYPLTYPGKIPENSGVVAHHQYYPMEPVEGSPVGEWELSVGGTPSTVGREMCRYGVDVSGSNYAVIAVGSNAAPSQMRRKFVDHGVPPVFPAVLVRIQGISSGVSAHINRSGYIPATPIETPGEESTLFVLWLNESQINALDQTEPNYQRESLPSSSIISTVGSNLDFPFVYVSKHGCLIDKTGAPRRLGNQKALIGALLSESAKLRELCGDTPDGFISNVQYSDIRKRANQVFREEDWVRSWTQGERP